jgi:acyl-CoA thioesterase
MMEKDEFSRWLGIEIVELKPGYSKLKMKIKKEMLNGFGIAHGGITFSLADSALAFASNNYGRIAVALETNLAFPKPVYEHDELIAEAIEQSKSNNTGIYNVTVTNQDNVKVGIFRGTVYRTKKEFFKE